MNNNALGLLPSHGAKLDSDGIVLRPGSRAKVRFGEFMFCVLRLSCCLWPRNCDTSYAYTFFIATNFKLSIYTLEFAKRPEYIRPGMRMLFRDGRVRGVGIITAVPTS